jgi:5'-3' exonuclease
MVERESSLQWNSSSCAITDWYSQAPGEAEAELAVMNRQGKIDAVLSDDVDALLFGATCLLRK